MQNQSLRKISFVVLILGSVALACEPDSEPGSNGDAGPSGVGGLAGAGFGSNDAAVVASDGSVIGPADSGTSVVDSGGPRSDAGGGMTGGMADAGASTGGGGSPGAGGGAVKSAGCGSTMAPMSGNYTINVGGMERSYILRLPDNYDSNRAYRFIIAYHPLAGSAQGTARGNYYGLLSMSDGSTIFVAPEGLPSLGGRLGWADTGRDRRAGGQDINFTKALVDDLTSKLCIDRSRIFAEGFSMGGSMSYAVACAMPDVFRGVVAHSGGPMSGCVQHDKPVAYFMTHGTNDPICTYPEYGVPELNDFAKVNGCMPRDMPTPSGNTPACVDFEGCMAGYPTRACIFVGDHTPSPPGTTWVPMETWKFISQF
jgi:poly(3-hydroxybutyrate) depolymerase